jgi:hypothetical protein
MMASLISYLFGCSHERTTFPMRTKRSTEASRQGTYIVCLDCGKEFDYNWKEMHAGAAVAPPVVTLSAVSR